MLITVAELKKYVQTTVDDSVLEAKIQALELAIRSYTNNNFQNRFMRSYCSISGKTITCLDAVKDTMFPKDATVQISQSCMGNNAIYNVIDCVDGIITVDSEMMDEENALVTRIMYPKDVIMGAVNMVSWDLTNRSKVGIQSETISRHSVTYFNMDGDNSVAGYPKSLLGFLEPYRKARF